MSVAARASRPLFFGPDGRVLFGWFHPPQAPSRRTGVVLCNPIGDDYVRAHRALRHLAEHLSRAGFSVLRFDFRGTGDSAGSEHDPARVRAWRADVRIAVDELRALGAVERMAVVGLRLGATMAMSALGEHPVDSLVLWSPYPNGGAYVRETTQLHRMQMLIEPESFASVPKGWNGGGEEALGFLLTPETSADLRAIDLFAVERAPATHSLIIDGSNVPSRTELVEHLRGIGSATDYRHIPNEKFLVQINHRSDVPNAGISEIVRWLSLHHTIESDGGKRTSTTAAIPSAGAPYGEEAIEFGSSHPLFGILVHPATGARDGRRPAIIMTNSGCVHRIGPHRFYVGMARRWAALGFPVFRVDLSGIGDSPVPPGCVENITYPRHGVQDLEDAMACLTERVGARKFIVIGLCSGGDLAFKVGFKDERVVGAVMMNPRTFCVHDLAMVEEFHAGAYPLDSLMRPASWKKLLRGQVDVRRAARTVLPRVTQMLKLRMSSLLQTPAPAKSGDGEERHNDVAGCLRLMAERGVSTILVVSPKDPGVDYVDRHFPDEMRALNEVRGFHREDMPGTDHTFTSLYAQQQVSQVITDHFLRRHMS
jgi:alpha-beta hydrolase superfamily lysophospholipase